MTTLRLEFNIETGSYKELIERIRALLQQPERFSHRRPVLPTRYAGVESRETLDLVLSTTNHTITLKLKREDLFIIGYQTQRGEWLEFGKNNEPNPVHLIPGSTFLGFRGSYDDIRSSGGDVENLRITRQTVLSAVDYLATAASGPGKAARLVILIVVICEASRFEYIRSELTIPISDRSDARSFTIEPWISANLFTNWGKLSKMLLRADASGDDSFLLPQNHPLRSRIPSAEQAADYVGLLKGPKEVRPTG